jgi:hypothetical protein
LPAADALPDWLDHAALAPKHLRCPKEGSHLYRRPTRTLRAVEDKLGLKQASIISAWAKTAAFVRMVLACRTAVVSQIMIAGGSWSTRAAREGDRLQLLRVSACQ